MVQCGNDIECGMRGMDAADIATEAVTNAALSPDLGVDARALVERVGRSHSPPDPEMPNRRL